MINNFHEQERGAIEWMKRAQVRVRELLEPLGFVVNEGPHHDEWTVEFPQGSDPEAMEVIFVSMMERATHETKPADSWVTVETTEGSC